MVEGIKTLDGLHLETNLSPIHAALGSLDQALSQLGINVPLTWSWRVRLWNACSYALCKLQGLFHRSSWLQREQIKSSLLLGWTELIITNDSAIPINGSRA